MMKNWLPALSGNMVRAMERTPGGVCEVVLKSVLGELTLDAVIRAAGACACRISALDHESRDDAVEDKAVIEAFFYQTDEVVYGVRRDFRVKLCFHHIAVFHSNCNDWVRHNVFLLIFKRFLDKT